MALPACGLGRELPCSSLDFPVFSYLVTIKDGQNVGKHVGKKADS